MKVVTKQTGCDLYIFFSGELDQSVADGVREKLEEILSVSQMKRVIFDMGSLHFMDSTGIGLIMGRYKRLKAKGIGVYITKPNPQIDKVLKISGLYNIIPLI